MFVEYLVNEDMNDMFFKNYILTTIRLMIAKWWLSLIKIFSLTSGILSFLLVLLFYIDPEYLSYGQFQLIKSCSTEDVLLLGFIIVITMVIYFLVIKSQIPYRHKEMFIKKYYGETSIGIVRIMTIETILYILVSFMISLVLIDQVTPIFNLITNKDIDVQQIAQPMIISIVMSFLFFFGVIIGILPSLLISRKRAVDILKKLPHSSIKF